MNVLDATAGGRGVWHDERKQRSSTVFVDRRIATIDGNPNWETRPDVVADFRRLPFPDSMFDLINWDPPHVARENGMQQLLGIMTKTYGALRTETWQTDLSSGFEELWRVLRPGGTLTLKWADTWKTHDQVLRLFDETPLYGTNGPNGAAKTRWWVFYKERGCNS